MGGGRVEVETASLGLKAHARARLQSILRCNLRRQHQATVLIDISPSALRRFGGRAPEELAGIYRHRGLLTISWIYGMLAES